MYNLDELMRTPSVAEEVRQQVHGDAEPTYLRSIKIKIISNCNLRCEMCKYWRIAKQKIEIDVIKRVLDDAVELGSKKVHFSGGEVTLHPDLEEAISHAAGLGMRVNLTSNGILMDKPRAKRWIAAGLRSASFSLDGIDSKTHDKIRGVDGAWKRTVKAVHILRREIARRKTKLKIRINTVLSKQNHRQLPGLIRLAGEMGALDVLPMPIDGDAVPRPSVEEIKRFNEEIAPLCLAERQRYGMSIDAGRLYPFGRTEEEMEFAAAGHYAFGHYKEHPCYAPWLHAFVSHPGDIYACCMTRERMPSLGNVNTQSLIEIFRGEPYRKFRRQMLAERMEICGNCDQYLRENRVVQTKLVQLETPSFAVSSVEGAS